MKKYLLGLIIVLTVIPSVSFSAGKINTKVAKPAIDLEKPVIAKWITVIDTEIQSSSDLIDQWSAPSLSKYSGNVIEVETAYLAAISNIRTRLNEIYSSNSKDYNQMASLKTESIALVNQYILLESESLANFKKAAKESLKKAKADAKAKQRKAEKKYQREYAERQAENQAIINSANSRVNQYNSITGQGRGIPSSIINGQLNRAGLINQRSCYFSSVGGMTPGSGSMTCY